MYIFCMMLLDFLKSCKNVITARKLKCCGMEDHTILAHGFRNSEDKKLKWGMEGKNAVNMAGCLHPLMQDSMLNK